jgi:hypothetical protein
MIKILIFAISTLCVSIAYGVVNIDCENYCEENCIKSVDECPLPKKNQTTNQLGSCEAKARDAEALQKACVRSCVKSCPKIGECSRNDDCVSAADSCDCSLQCVTKFTPSRPDCARACEVFTKDNTKKCGCEKNKCSWR